MDGWRRCCRGFPSHHEPHIVWLADILPTKIEDHQPSEGKKECVEIIHLQGYDVGKEGQLQHASQPKTSLSVSQRLSESAVGEPGLRFGFGVAIPRSARGNSVTLGNYLANGGSVVFVGNVLFTYIYLHTVVE